MTTTGKTWILSQWFREEINEADAWYYDKWRAALHKYAPGVPVLVMHNGGPTDPPYTDVVIRHATDMAPHGRGQHGHWVNSWKSPCQGMQWLYEQGAECVVFIGQNLVVGTEFVTECEEGLKEADVLFNLGCLGPFNAFVEYYAANPQTTAKSLFSHEYTNGVLECAFPHWVREAGARPGPFPKLWKMRDWGLQPEDTFLYHSTAEECHAFCEERGI